MSVGHMDAVFKHSPYTGAHYMIHLCLADTANADHGDELWMSVGQLARKARVDERTVQRVLADMVSDGALDLLEAPAGKTRRYRFHDPRPLVTPDEMSPPATCRGRGDTVPGEGVTSDPERGDTTPPNPKRTQVVTQGEHQHGFAAFWAAYPRRTARRAAERAWKTAAKRGDPPAIIAAAARYAQDPNREDAYTCHPATWLNQDRWHDPPLPARGRPRSATDDSFDAITATWLHPPQKELTG